MVSVHVCALILAYYYTELLYWFLHVIDYNSILNQNCVKAFVIAMNPFIM